MKGPGAYTGIRHQRGVSVHDALKRAIYIYEIPEGEIVG
jgi:hypothetical protein